MGESASDKLLELCAPLSGWALPLAEVPDPVFAGGMAGDGLAIDPVQGLLQAPCAGRVQLLPNASHALTLRTVAGDVLLHVGIDTVKLAGRGFELLVRDGEAVRALQPLIRFDLDAVARGAPSLVTPMLISGVRIVERRVGVYVSAGDVILRVALAPATAVAASLGAATAGAASPGAESLRLTLRVGFEHGLHARPAARVAALLVGLEVEARASARGRQANLRSAVALMSLGLRQGEVFEAELRGRDASQAAERLAGILERADPPAQGPMAGLGRSAGAGRMDLAVPALDARPVEPPASGARLPARAAVPGIAAGVAIRVGSELPPVAPSSGDAREEKRKLRAAIGDVAARLARLSSSQYAVQAELLAAHAALLADPELLREAEVAIDAGQGAGAAWRNVLEAAGAQLASLGDERQAERRADLADIETQVLRVLAGQPPDGLVTLPEQAIVLARELLPSQFLALDRRRLAGLCMSEGGATSHVAILAAAAGTPTLVAAGPAVLAIANGIPLLLDADAGELLVDPPVAEREALATRRARAAAELSQALAVAQMPAVTRDGVRVHVFCNLGGRSEVAEAMRQGAEGCGLLRTEFLFLERLLPPGESEQLSEYQAISDGLDGRMLTVRTLDAGGDKPIAYLPSPPEENPALGLRGIRSGLREPAVLRAQLRAILRVRPAGRARILLPMITDVAEVRAVRALLDEEARSLGVPAAALGVMIETPASALLADQLADCVQFFSIGSNDLSQYTLAMDRQHAELGRGLDALHPAVLRLMRRVCIAGAERGIEVAVCGGIAADVAALPILLGLGARELSVPPAGIARLKARIRAQSIADCEALAEEAMQLPDAAAVRGRLKG